MDHREVLPPSVWSEILRVSVLVPSVKWYIFGSLLRRPRQAADIDILVIYRSDDAAETIRRELREISIRFPIHLLFLSECEEVELQFVESQRCVPISLSR